MSATTAERWAKDELDALAKKGLRRVLEPLEGPQGAVIRLGGEQLINFSSNDYLGLAADLRVAESLRSAVETYGVGSGASRLIVGDSLAHAMLEKRIAQLMSTEAALVFNSGYAANTGILSTLLGKQDVVFSDELNHASLVDGCRMSRAKTVVYPHGDVDALKKLLTEHPGRRRMIATDAVFSMDGDWAPLKALVELAEESGAALLVDEAHALGLFGKLGAGLSEELGIADRVDVRMGTLGKAFGCFGAFAATTPHIAELLMNRARSFVFSTSLPAALCLAAETAIDVSMNDETLRARAWRNIRKFAEGLRGLGIRREPSSAIFPIIVGEPDEALALSRQLRDRRILVKAIRPPTVPEGSSRLRVSISAAHTEGQVELLLKTLKELKVRGRPL